MTRFRSSAGYRIAVIYSAAFAIAILLLGIAVYFAADAEFRRQRDAAIGDELADLVRVGSPATLRHIIAERETPGLSDGFVYALFDVPGQRIAGRLDTTMPQPGVAMIVFNDPREGPDQALAHTARLATGESLVVAVDSEAIERIDATILALFGIAFMMVLLIGVLGAFILGSYLRRRLATISDTAQLIVAGDLTRRVAISPAGDEFDQVGQALNAMLNRIAQLMENLRQVSSDVAHDLRTPLVRLRNQLDQIGTVEGAAERAIALGDEMLLLFGSLLHIAEVEGGDLSRTFSKIALSDLLEDVSDSFQPAVTDGGRSLRCAIKPGIHVLGDRELLAQTVANLIDNAHVHTPQGTNILLSLDVEKDQARIIVSDDGPGVPPAERSRLLQRFYRTERSRTTPGNGLGLSLVAAIATAHGGEVKIANGLGLSLVSPPVREGQTASAQGVGLSIILTLPRIAK